MLRGTAAGLEFVFSSLPFEQASAGLYERLAERAEFYRGSVATAIFTLDVPDDISFAPFLAAVREHGIDLRGLYGDESTAGLAARHGLTYLGFPPRPTPDLSEIDRKRAARAERPAPGLTEQARSLEPDFAGARADLAARRARRAVRSAHGSSTQPAPPSPLAPVTATLYHRGTLRGGQALQHVGNIVVVGDVNPGAELVASGDILVFGALRGTAHAGAQGDFEARVGALELAPTQLRIATLIAASDGRRHAREPEEAYVIEQRIVIAPFGRVKG